MSSKSQVFYAAQQPGASKEEIISNLNRLIAKLPLDQAIESHDQVAVKSHFGDEKNQTHVPPWQLKVVIEAIQKRGASPFLTETSVLYKSLRDTGVGHLQLANKHGFSQETMGVPIIMADGLVGSSEVAVPVKGEIFEEVLIAEAAVQADALFVFSHVTGHLGIGVGAAIKNLGMGLSSRKGKLRQHSTSKPSVNQQACTGCRVCVQWCPADAIVMIDKKAQINHDICIGCGQCLTVCRFDAVRHNWSRSPEDLQKRVAEHAQGALWQKEGKALFINSLNQITKDCDCIPGNQTPLIQDLGFIAGTDPVALDQAGMDLIVKNSGKTLREMAYPGIDPTVQIAHAVKIGLGSNEYELIEV